MAELEQLQIIIDVIGDFEEELNHLLFKLGEVETAVQAVDPIKIDVEVNGEHELDTLIAQLAMLETMDLGGMGDIVLGEKNIRHSGSTGVSRRAISSQTEDLQKTMTELTEGLTDTLTDLEVETGNASRSMREASDAADEASEGFLNTDIRMTDLHNALARLVPLILLFLGAMPAVISALAALAAAAVAAGVALAGLGGLAALGFGAAEGGRGDIMGGLGTAADEIVSDFLDAFLPVAKRLAPLFEDALDGLDRLFQNIANNSDALVDMSNVARDFGQWVINTLPSFLEDVAQFAQAVAPALGAIVGAIGNMDFFAALAGILEEVLPALMVMGALVADILPHLIRMSVGFLQVANTVLYFVNLLMDLLTVGPLTGQMLGVLVGSILAVYSAVLLLNSSLLTTAGKVLVLLGSALVKTTVTLWNYVTGANAAATATTNLSRSMMLLRGAIAATGIGALAILFGTIASSATDAATGIDKATKSLKDFQDMQDSVSGGKNPYANPDVQRGQVAGSRFGGGGNTVNVQIQGDADEETVRNQTQNAMYRLERPQRSR